MLRNSLYSVCVRVHKLFIFLFFSTKEDRFSVSIQPAVGELLLPVTMSEQDFNREQGTK